LLWNEVEAGPSTGARNVYLPIRAFGVLSAMIGTAAVLYPYVHQCTAQDVVAIAELPAVQRTLNDAPQQQQEQDRQLQQIHKCIHAKKEVVAAVQTGRLSLIEAAEQFCALDKEYAIKRPDMLHIFAVDSEQEAYCRCVACWLDPQGQR
jgi:16S rRNA G1207 methylase RsmC